MLVLMVPIQMKQLYYAVYPRALAFYLHKGNLDLDVVYT